MEGYYSIVSTDLLCLSGPYCGYGYILFKQKVIGISHRSGRSEYANSS